MYSQEYITGKEKKKKFKKRKMFRSHKHREYSGQKTESTHPTIGKKMALDEFSNRRGWKRNKMLKERSTTFPLEAVFPKDSFLSF